MGNMVFGADVAGIVVNSPVTDWLGATAFWIRPFDSWRNDNNDADDEFFGNQDNLNDEMDVFGLVLPLSFDGFTALAFEGQLKSVRKPDGFV